jgi:predicted small metal-binding protein
MTVQPEILTTTCACGWEVTGPRDEVVDAVIEHGQRLHNMTATRETVLANARRTEAPEEESQGKDLGGSS